MRATNLRNTSHTTIPRTPPEGFINVVIPPRRMALTISAGISALATSCAKSQNNSLSHCCARGAGGRTSFQKGPLVLLFSNFAHCAKTNRCRKRPVWLAGDAEPPQGLVHEVLVAFDVDPSTLLMWPRLQRQWLHLPMRDLSKSSHRPCPLSPPFRRICASCGACLRVARGNCRLPAGHDQIHPPAICKLRKPFSEFRFGDQTTLPWLLQQHAGQHEEDLPPRPTRISCMATLIAETYAPEKNFGGHRITVALWRRHPNWQNRGGMLLVGVQRAHDVGHLQKAIKNVQC